MPHCVGHAGGCGKEITDDEIIYGDLLNTPPVVSMPYCADCCPPSHRKPKDES